MAAFQRIEMKRVNTGLDGDARLGDRRVRGVFFRQVGVRGHLPAACLDAETIHGVQLVRCHGVGFAVATAAEIETEARVDLALEVAAKADLIDAAMR